MQFVDCKDNGFEGLNHAVQEILPFSAVKISHLQALFLIVVSMEWWVLVEFEANGKRHSLRPVIHLRRRRKCGSVSVCLLEWAARTNYVGHRVMRGRRRSISVHEEGEILDDLVRDDGIPRIRP